MNELKSLTWKYFWQQKLKEIMIALLIIVGAIFIPYLVGSLIPDYFQLTIMGTDICYIERQVNCGLGFWEHWVTGLLIVLFGGLIISLIIKGIYEWIKSNWTKASERASEELNYDNPNESILDLR